MSEGGQFHFDPATYMQLMREEVPAYDEFQDAVADAAAAVVATRILDLGTGTGETMTRINARHPHAELVGIDEDDDMLAVARRRLPQARLAVAQLQDPLPEGPFDLVVSALAVHHLEPTEKADLFRRVAHVCTSDARFVLGDVVIPTDASEATTPLDPEYDKPSGVDEQLEWLRDAGFDAHLVWQRGDLAVIRADRGATS